MFDPTDTELARIQIRMLALVVAATAAWVAVFALVLALMSGAIS